MKHLCIKCTAIVLICSILSLPLFGCKKDPANNTSGGSSVLSNENNSQDDMFPGDISGTDSNDSASGTGSNGNDNNNQGGDNQGGNNNAGGGNQGTAVTGTELTKHYYNVKNYGAKGDGKTDDAGAIQKAMDAAKNAKGGVVYLPSGMYLMKKGLTVPMGVVIQGEAPGTKSVWKEVKIQTSTQSAQTAGSTFLSSANFEGTFIVVDHGKGNVNSNPTFRMQGNTGISSIGFVYKEQTPITDSVSPYPPAIAMYSTNTYKGTREGVAIDDIYFANAYIGIAIGEIHDLNSYDEGAPEGVSIGRLRIHNITGGPLSKGIFIKGVLDTVDMNNIDFGYTNFVPSYAKYRYNNCRDLELAREDGAMVNDFTSFGACYGIKSTYAHSGASSLRANNLKIYGKYPLHFTSGMHKVYNSHIEMVNYNNYSNDKNFAGISLYTNLSCVHQPFYLFNQVTVKNSIGGNNNNDSSLDIRLAKSGNLTMNDCTFTNTSGNNSVPAFNFNASDRSANSAIFYNIKVDGSNSGLLATINNMGTGAVQFNQSTISDGLYNSVSSVREIWFLNSKLASGKTINKHS